MIIDGSDTVSIDLAVAMLLKGGLIGLPTETVYGLASDALNDDATLKIFDLKGRPVDHPLIAHVADAAAIQHFANEIPGFANNLMAKLWPGPLTLILNKNVDIANACTGGAATIALRCPAHKVAQNLLRRCQDVGIWGLAAPSANRFGRVSPTTARHVLDEFGDSLMILDGGPCAVGIESTIVDCTRGKPIVLRPGTLTLAEISHAAECVAFSSGELVQKDSLTKASSPKASGTLESHYAPNARVCLHSIQEMHERLQTGSRQNLNTDSDAILAIWARVKPLTQDKVQNFLYEIMPNNPQECAKVLFAQLRAFDDQGITEIWIETPPQAPEWAGITDRLQRAAYSGTEPR